MTITVTPETFHFVAFDAAYTLRIAQRVAALIGIDDIDINIEIDETNPLQRIDVTATPSLITIAPLSGALEDTRRPRQQGELATTVAMAKGMLRAHDRLRGGFADAPADADLTLPQAAAWDSYIMARISRFDIDVRKQAWLYNFRNRHGFTDAVDTTFEKIWNTPSITWAELNALSNSF